MFKDDSKIRQEIKRLRKLSKKFPLLFARIGECYIDLGDLDEAEKVLLDGLRRYPDYITGYLLAGECYLYRGRTRDAEEIARKGLHKSPSHLGLLDLMRRIKKQAEEFEDLEKVHRSIRELDPLRTGTAISSVDSSIIAEHEPESASEELISTPAEAENSIVSGEISAVPDTETPFGATPPPKEEDRLEETLQEIAGEDVSDQFEKTRQDKPVPEKPSEPATAETGEESPSEGIEEIRDDTVKEEPESALNAAPEPSGEDQSDKVIQADPETVAESPKEPFASEPLEEAAKPEQTSTPPVELEEERGIPQTASEPKDSLIPESQRDQEPEVSGDSEVPLAKPAHPEPEVSAQAEPQTPAESPAANFPDDKGSPQEESIFPDKLEFVSRGLKALAEEEKVPSVPEQTESGTELPCESLSQGKAPEYSDEENRLISEEKGAIDEVRVEVTDNSSPADNSEEILPKKPKPEGRLKKRFKELAKLFAEEEGKDAFGLPLNFDEQSAGDEAAQKDETVKTTAGYNEKATPERTTSAATESQGTGDQTQKPKKPKIATKTLGELYATQKKYDEAIEIYEKLIEKDPQNEAYIQRLAELKKRRAEALG